MVFVGQWVTPDNVTFRHRFVPSLLDDLHEL